MQLPWCFAHRWKAACLIFAMAPSDFVHTSQFLRRGSKCGRGSKTGVPKVGLWTTFLFCMASNLNMQTKKYQLSLLQFFYLQIGTEKMTISAQGVISWGPIFKWKFSTKYFFLLRNVLLVTQWLRVWGKAHYCCILPYPGDLWQERQLFLSTLVFMPMEVWKSVLERAKKWHFCHPLRPSYVTHREWSHLP